MTATDDETFLARWSRRKAEARLPEPEAVPEPGQDEIDPLQPLPTETLDPEPIELPDPSTLDADSDYRPFMQAGVPPTLRRDALRKLWRTNPIINSLDGLDDHYVTHDFTDAATVVGDLRTLYRVGKGMLEIVDDLAADEVRCPDAAPVVPSLPDVADKEVPAAEQFASSDAKCGLART